MAWRTLRVVSAASLAAACLTVLPALVPAATAAVAHHVIGDFDGDGRPDLAVGATGANRVHVHYSSAHGGSHNATLRPNAHSHHYKMQFGSALAIGDFNGDGFADLAVGAPDFTTPPNPEIGSGVLETRGAVFLFLGSSSGLHAQPLAIEGPYDGDDPFNLGQALAAADVDGDGKDDLAVTLLGADNGNIHVYRGTASGLDPVYQPLDDYEATSLAFGDVNGDHHLDLVAGSTVDLTNPSDEFYGDVMIFRGSASGLRSDHPQRIRGDQVGVFRDLGTAVATGDVNGDGISDVVVGAAFDRDVTHASAGTIVLLTGSSHGLKASRHQVVHERAINANWRDGNGFGFALDVAKVTGDRFGDVLVGAVGEKVGSTKHAGAVYLLRGSNHGISTNHVQRFTQATPGIPGSVSKKARFGFSVYAGQLNGDRFADAAIGVPGASAHASHSGMYVTMRGADDGLRADSAREVGGTRAFGQLGTSIA
jgi:hypothetical protein